MVTTAARAAFSTTLTRNLRLWLMMVLTFVTGVLDAVGYLGLDRIFTGNMTGNIVILGMGLAPEDDLPVAGPIIALVGYVVGAAVVGGMLRGRERAWSGRITATFVVSALILFAAATALLVFDIKGRSFYGIMVAATIATLMGAQAAAARFLAVPDMTTVVVTSTITAYASETLHSLGKGIFTHRRLWAVLFIGIGAFVGALLMKVHLCVPVYLAAALTLLTATAGRAGWNRATG